MYHDYKISSNGGEPFPFAVYKSYASMVPSRTSLGSGKGDLTYVGKWHGVGSLDLTFAPIFEESNFRGYEFRVATLEVSFL